MLSRGKGPRILFFSGGTALKETARALAAHTSRAAYLITPFDSGGSSAELRRAFAMPAVGDLRSRIMALADATVPGHAEIFTLFSYRLPKDEDTKALRMELEDLLRGGHPLLKQIPDPVRGIVKRHLGWFARRMPADFDLAGACVGNLVLAGGYLEQGRRLGPVIALFSRLVRARGLVRPIVGQAAHLAVRLTTGEVLVGQHRFTGKDGGGISAPIADMWLTGTENSPEPAHLGILPRTARLIYEAEALCYPVGSFYSSVLANLLPSGVGRAVASAQCPKIFVPNLGADPELLGHTLKLQVERLLRPLSADVPSCMPPSAFLTELLVDEDETHYPGGIPYEWLHSLGILVRKARLTSAKSLPLAHPSLLASALIKIPPREVRDGDPQTNTIF